jgi:hypothetical protein
MGDLFTETGLHMDVDGISA